MTKKYNKKTNGIYYTYRIIPHSSCPSRSSSRYHLTLRFLVRFFLILHLNLFFILENSLLVIIAKLELTTTFPLDVLKGWWRLIAVRGMDPSTIICRRRNRGRARSRRTSRGQYMNPYMALVGKLLTGNPARDFPL